MRIHRPGSSLADHEPRDARKRAPQWSRVLLPALLLTLLTASPRPGRGVSLESLVSRLTSIREVRKTLVEKRLSQSLEVASHLAGTAWIGRALEDFQSAMISHGVDATAYQQAWSRQSSRIIGWASEVDNLYDLLLVDPEGLVVYSLRREKDFGARLTDPSFRSTAIAACWSRAMEGRAPTFSSFDQYNPSNDIAAFACAPVLDQAGKILGVAVVQTSVVTVNSVLTEHNGLGKSGESYLVDARRLMLTPSRFLGDRSMLTPIETTAVDQGLTGKSGCEFIKDYRGIPVISSFSSLNLPGIELVIIVEMDQQEALELLSLEEKDILYSMLSEVYSDQPGTVSRLGRRLNLEGRTVLWAMTGQIQYAAAGEVLAAPGISTCTALVVQTADGRGYAVHFSPVDRIYGHGLIVREVWLRDRATDLMEELAVWWEKNRDRPKQMTAIIFATHYRSLGPLAQALVSQGISGDRIHLYLGTPNHALDLVFDSRSRQVQVTSRPAGDDSNQGTSLVMISPAQTPSLSDLLARACNRRMTTIL